MQVLELANKALLRALAKDLDIVPALTSSSPNLLDVVPASGAAILWEGQSL